ncbi:arsenate reductase [Algimonas arctica]|uniref:Arsenate reductase n=1 Tax=Algimonas arctica TaxID=1479486 RepID=A0A8J3CUW8_9PROT|nr:low molecular weight phosphatase family protein [Algimonas arctica]GHB03340.1 arsenate reductase [Algimonas arctica]
MNDRILFVCQLNMVRSPMAEGLARKKGLDAISCGIDPGVEADELMMSVMRDVGIDMSQHEPRSLQSVAGQTFARIITFSEDSKAAANAIFGANAPIELWSIPMPSMGSHDVRAIMETYRSIRTVISNRLDRQF